MSIEDIIKAWKSDEEAGEVAPLDNPIGEELSSQELQEVVGGMPCNSVGTCRIYTLLQYP